MTSHEFTDTSVEATYSGLPALVKPKLLALRDLILDTAAKTEGVGRVQETLKWGQPSFLTPETKSGSTIRIDADRRVPGQYALYFICNTNLVETFRALYPAELTYGGNRSILLNEADTIPEDKLRHCIALALTYHLRKKIGRRQTA